MALIAFRSSCPLRFLAVQRKAKKFTLSVLCVSAVNYYPNYKRQVTLNDEP
jgi:hypothetical protein